MKGDPKLAGRLRARLKLPVMAGPMFIDTGSPGSPTDYAKARGHWNQRMKIRRVLLVSRPRGVAQAENFAIEEAELSPPAGGQIRVRNAFLSVEPAMRGWIADRGNYSAPVEIGSVMRSLAVGEVVESNAAGVSAGRDRHGLVRLAGLRRCRAFVRSSAA